VGEEDLADRPRREASLSQRLGIPVSELEASVYGVMRGDADLGRVMRGAKSAEEAANERKEESLKKDHEKVGEATAEERA
jgi:hypothetical protein